MPTPYTRAKLEAVLIGRIGGKFRSAGLDGTTKDGHNADLADPIASAVRGLGRPLADDANPADSDLAAFSGRDIDRLQDAATISCLYKFLGAYSEVDEKAGNDQQWLSQLADQAQKTIELMEARLVDPAAGATIGSTAFGVMKAVRADRPRPWGPWGAF